MRKPRSLGIHKMHDDAIVFDGKPMKEVPELDNAEQYATIYVQVTRGDQIEAGKHYMFHEGAEDECF